MTAFKIKNELPFLGENLRAFKDGFFDEEETEDSEEQTEEDEENSEAEEREEVADEPEEVVVTVHSSTQTDDLGEPKKLGFFDLGSPLADRILQFSRATSIIRILSILWVLGVYYLECVFLVRFFLSRSASN